jgi:hypothetical protein
MKAPVRSQNQASRRHRRVLLESLETRQLLSLPVLAGGTLMVNGTSGDDQIVISRDPVGVGVLRVAVNKSINSVDEYQVKKITINGLAGNDNILIDQSLGRIAIPVYEVGGLGNDTLTGGYANDLLQGGPGNDELRGNAGKDYLDGGAGNDTVYGADGIDALFGGVGADGLYTGGDSRDTINTGNNPGDFVDRSPANFQPLHITRSTGSQPHFSGTPVGLIPDQVLHAYGIDNLSLTGAGQTIAIVDAFDDPTVRHDLEIFSQQFGLTMPSRDNFQVYYAAKHRPNTDAGWAGEISLDVQWAHAVAPDAKIVLVEAASNSEVDLYRAVDFAVNLLQPTGGVISMSFGRSELFFDPLKNTIFHNERTKNISFIASAGDTAGLTGAPADLADVLAIGGTFINVDSSGNLLTPEEGWAAGSGGISSFVPRPSYQAGVKIGDFTLDNRRAIPDVSYNGDPRSGVATFDTTPDVLGNTGWQAVGGTSAGSPQWAGLVALVNEQRAANGDGVIGNSLNRAIYAAAADDYAGNFIDVQTGFSFYPALPGFDLITGLGSPHADSLVPTLADFDVTDSETNLTFSAARLQVAPAGKTASSPQTIFGGTGVASLNNDGSWNLDLVASAQSGVSIALDGPLTPDENGVLTGTGTVDVVLSPKITVTSLIRVVARTVTRGGQTRLVGEFFIVSKRGKIIYQGNKPAFRGTFTTQPV